MRHALSPLSCGKVDALSRSTAIVEMMTLHPFRGDRKDSCASSAIFLCSAQARLSHLLGDASTTDADTLYVAVLFDHFVLNSHVMRRLTTINLYSHTLDWTLHVRALRGCSAPCPFGVMQCLLVSKHVVKFVFVPTPCLTCPSNSESKLLVMPFCSSLRRNGRH